MKVNFFSFILITLFLSCFSAACSVKDVDDQNRETEQNDQSGGSGGALPDSENGSLEDDESFPDNDNDEDDIIFKDEGKCDCFGKEYPIPAQFADIEGWCKADDDGDGIPNCIEAPNGVLVDTDEDGTPDYLDLDSDGDGIPDEYECPDFTAENKCRDTDGDGVPDYRDTDSDGDGIPDEYECPDFAAENKCIDSDGDGVPDYLDTDSDGDGIPDRVECPGQPCRDSDGDGIPDYLDLDSDGDGIPDSVECPEQPCRDTDEDGFPDYLDLDSDNDGLSDAKEIEIGTDPYNPDTDGDGIDDNTEVAAGSDPLVSDPEFYEGQFYVILPYEEPEKNDILKFDTKIKKADILFHFDLTGSMANAIDTVKNDIKNKIIPGVKAVLEDPAFGIASYKHIESTPHVMNQPITTDADKLTAALSNMSAPGSGSIDSQYETLFQGASGHGFNGELLKFDSDKCFNELALCLISYGMGDMSSYYKPYKTISLAPQECTGQMGNIGGGCFREAALPIQILMTDEALYDVNKDILSDKGITAYNYIWNDSKPDQGHYHSEVVAEMNAINSKFIGIMGTSLTSELLDTIQKRMKEIADDTDSKTAEGDHFIFQVGYSGGGLSDEMVTAINDLLLNIKRDITTQKKSIANIHSIDTAQFIKKIIPDSSIPPENYDSKDDEWFYNVRPNTEVLFDLTFENTIFKPTTTENTLFRAKITVYGEGAILDTRDVFIIVPGIKEDGGIKN